MATALDLITGALLNINSFQVGDQLPAHEANSCLTVLNDLLDSWSTDNAYVYGSSETIVNFTPGKFQYTIGQGGDFSVDAATGQPIVRPLRITNAFTRITTGNAGLDYPIEIIAQDQYARIGLKSITAPWPLVLYYNYTYPLGNIYFYQCPNSAGELHLFTDTILSNLTLQQTFVLPQGYSRAIKWMLAKELAPQFGMPVSADIKANADEAMRFLKALNVIPVPISRYDGSLAGKNLYDASFILNGGFN